MHASIFEWFIFKYPLFQQPQWEAARLTLFPAFLSPQQVVLCQDAPVATRLRCLQEVLRFQEWKYVQSQLLTNQGNVKRAANSQQNTTTGRRPGDTRPSPLWAAGRWSRAETAARSPASYAWPAWAHSCRSAHPALAASPGRSSSADSTSKRGDRFHSGAWHQLTTTPNALSFRWHHHYSINLEKDVDHTCQTQGPGA